MNVDPGQAHWTPTTCYNFASLRKLSHYITDHDFDQVCQTSGKDAMRFREIFRPDLSVHRLLTNATGFLVS